MEIDYLCLLNWLKLHLNLLQLSFTWVFNTQFYIKDITIPKTIQHYWNSEIIIFFPFNKESKYLIKSISKLINIDRILKNGWQ